MRVVLLTGRGRQHRYVAGVLARELGPELAAVIVAQPRPAGSRLRSYLRRYTARQLLSRLAAKLYDRASGSRQARVAAYARFFPLDEDPAERWIRVPGHNGPECLDLLARLAPDVVAVYGTAMIRPPVMERARRGSVNLHTGISPRYRGSDTLFWALHNEEPAWVGATIHLLDPGIDSGPILAVVRPEITAEDDEHTLFCKCVMLGARRLAEEIRAVAAGTAVSRPQCLAEGREYRTVERTMAAERRVRNLLREGLLCRYAGGS